MALPSLPNLLDFSPAELRTHFKKVGLEAYRANQILEWIYGKSVYRFEGMTNLPAALREKLGTLFTIGVPEVARREKSEDDQSVKLLLTLPSTDQVEAVYMPMKTRQTVCVSSQVGCKFHCAFCASGQDGFFRNLTPGEILAQILLARDASLDKKITHIVFMGIGEPFDNYDNVLKTIRILNDPATLGIGARRMTVSTCGVVPKIQAFSKEGLQVELSISLHGATDIVRGSIMPVNRPYPLKELMAVCREYAKKTKRAITFEYIMIKGVNASDKEAKDLVKLLKGLLCKVNLIPYNAIEEFPHAAPDYPDLVHFQQILQDSGIKTTVRFSKGQDIKAACGQLRSVTFKEKKAGGISIQ